MGFVIYLLIIILFVKADRGYFNFVGFNYIYCLSSFITKLALQSYSFVNNHLGFYFYQKLKLLKNK